MRVDNPSQEQMTAYFATLEKRAEQRGLAESFKEIRYLDMGTHSVRLINYARAFTPHIDKQLTYALRDSAPRYDATIVTWQEEDFASLAPNIAPPTSLLERVRRLAGGPCDPSLFVFDDGYSRWNPAIAIDSWSRTAYAHNAATSTHYYCAENLAAEEYIKQGHLFVQALNTILKTENSGLVHGAAIGFDGNGVLLCARGQRGKSTLAVRALLDGFEYVSDDYLVLGREKDGLYTWPIYSIITLAPMMYNDLYNIFDAKFVSNNSRKDKYIFNIDKYHGRFVSRYPIKMGMIPQIVSDLEPSVVACSQRGKGRAITQLVHSTIIQMRDRHDTATIRKIIGLVIDLPFYQINLCRDIEKNLRCLKTFLQTGECRQQQDSANMLSSVAVSQGIFGKS